LKIKTTIYTPKMKIERAKERQRVMVNLFGVIDNMRCVSHFLKLWTTYSKEKKNTKIKVATKRGFVAKRERQVEKQRGPCCLVRWKVL